MFVEDSHSAVLLASVGGSNTFSLKQEFSFIICYLKITKGFRNEEKFAIFKPSAGVAFHCEITDTYRPDLTKYFFFKISCTNLSDLDIFLGLVRRPS